MSESNAVLFVWVLVTIVFPLAVIAAVLADR